MREENQMDHLTCSLCGWTSPQKRFPDKAVNRHFDNAVAIWCPRSECQEHYPHEVPRDCVQHQWQSYGGWITIEPKPKVVSIKDWKRAQQAKGIFRRRLEQGRHSE